MEWTTLSQSKKGSSNDFRAYTMLSWLFGDSKSLIRPASVSENFSVKITSVDLTIDFYFWMNVSTLEESTESFIFEKDQRNFSTFELKTKWCIWLQICLEFTSKWEYWKLKWASKLGISACSIVLSKPSSPKYCSSTCLERGLGVYALKRNP